MYKYRININWLTLSEELDYYIAASTDRDAKKYFLYFLIKSIKKENLIFDRIRITSSGFELVGEYKNQLYVRGKLSCLPTKYKMVPKMEYLQQETLANELGHLCKKSNSSILKNIWQG